MAIKGVGRFSELAAAEARERFIIGTLSSLLWACVVGRARETGDLVNDNRDETLGALVQAMSPSSAA